MAAHPIDEVVRRLRVLAGDHELEAAYHREFIPDGYPVDGVVQHALDAAAQGGAALGLHEALDALLEALGGPES